MSDDPPSHSPKKVLIVEDNALNLKLLYDTSNITVIRYWQRDVEEKCSISPASISLGAMLGAEIVGN